MVSLRTALTFFRTGELFILAVQLLDAPSLGVDLVSHTSVHQAMFVPTVLAFDQFDEL